MILVGVACEQREPGVIRFADGAAQWVAVRIALDKILKEPAQNCLVDLHEVILSKRTNGRLSGCMTTSAHAGAPHE